MKSALIALLFLAVPTPAIADNLPVNYMIWRGKVINLDHLWGKGVVQATAQSAQPTAQTVSAPTTSSDSREVAENNQRVEFENARNRLIIEQLRR